VKLCGKLYELVKEAAHCSECVFLFALIAKLVPVGFGIHKLQIMCVVEDEKVSVDLLIEEIQNFQEYVQSVDIVAFNKI
jgi:translation elongation factor EF-1beta